MSSRVLRKLGLQGEKDTTSLADEASDTEADFSSSGGAKKKQLNINRYDLVSAKRQGLHLGRGLLCYLGDRLS